MSPLRPAPPAVEGRYRSSPLRGSLVVEQRLVRPPEAAGRAVVQSMGMQVAYLPFKAPHPCVESGPAEARVPHSPAVPLFACAFLQAEEEQTGLGGHTPNLTKRHRCLGLRQGQKRGAAPDGIKGRCGAVT